MADKMEDVFTRATFEVSQKWQLIELYAHEVTLQVAEKTIKRN